MQFTVCILGCVCAGRAAAERFSARSPRATQVTFASGAISAQKKFEKNTAPFFFQKTRHRDCYTVTCDCYTVTCDPRVCVKEREQWFRIGVSVQYSRKMEGSYLEVGTKYIIWSSEIGGNV